MKNKFKYCILVLALFLFVLSFPISTKASSDFQIVGTTLRKYEGTSTTVNIPEGITKIGQSAFENNTTVVEVVLPLSVKEIEIRAFTGCTSLAKINIENIEKFGEMCFQSTSLGEVSLPSKITDIPLGMFAYANITKVTLPENIISIASRAFFNCEILTEVNLSSNIYTIGDGAFANCTSLKQITLPKNLSTIGVEAFSSSGITEIEFPSSLEVIPKSICSGCASLKKITINEGVKKIGTGAFTDTLITTVELPKSLEELEYAAFNFNNELESITTKEGCIGYTSDNGILYTKNYESIVLIPRAYKLKTVNLHDGVKTSEEIFASELKNVTRIVIPEGMEIINHDAFASSTRLEEVVLPDSLKEILSGAFSYCTALVKVDLPEGLKVLSTSEFWIGVFTNCESLEEVILPNSLEKLGPFTFNYCTNLKRVVIPSGISDFGLNQFMECPNLEEIVVLEGNPFAYTDDGIYYEIREGKTYLTVYPAAKSGKTYTIPQTVENIAAFAFSAVKNLEKVVVSKNVSLMGPGIFQDATSLREVVFENDIRTLPNATFHSSSIENVVLPKNLEIIESDVFVSCKNLKSITFPETLKSILGNAFNYSGLKKVVLPNSVITIEQAFMYCYDLEEIVLSTSLKTIFASCFRESKIKEITIPESMVEIPAHAFNSCLLLEIVRLPKTISKFTTASFSNCDNLKDVIVDPENKYIKEEDGILYNEDYTEILFVNKNRVSEKIQIKDTITIIPQAAFKNITEIKEISFPSSIEKYEYEALLGASFEKVIFEEGTKTIQYGILEDCRNLTSVVLPSTLTTIESAVFFGCVSLEEFVIPENVNINEAYSLFQDCINLKNVTLPSDATIIPQFMFKNCSSLKEVILPENLEKIETNAFAGCTGINKIIIPKTVESMEYDAFVESSIEEIVFLGNAPVLLPSKFGNTYFEEKANIYYSLQAKGFTSSTYRPYARQLKTFKNDLFNEKITFDIIDSGTHDISLNASVTYATSYKFYVYQNDIYELIEETSSPSIIYSDVIGGNTYKFKVETIIFDPLKEENYISYQEKEVTIVKNDLDYKLDYITSLIASFDLNYDYSLDELKAVVDKVSAFDDVTKEYILKTSNYEILEKAYLEKLEYEKDIQKITKIEIKNPKSELLIGTTHKLEIEFLEDVKNKDLKYTSTNPNVVTVSDEGIITAKSKGNATIIVTALSGVKTQMMLEVKEQTTNKGLIIACSVSLGLISAGAIFMVVYFKKRGGKHEAK